MRSPLFFQIFLITTLFSSTACNKEKKFNTDIYSVEIDDKANATVNTEYILNGNKDSVYTGLCWSENSHPTIADFSIQQAQLSTGSKFYDINALKYSTNYHFRSYIIKQSGEIAYSQNQTFKTPFLPPAPCETEPGLVYFNNSDFDISSYSESYVYNGADDSLYKLKTYSAYGELTFIFSEKPTKNENYRAVSSYTDISRYTVRVNSIIGSFGCNYYPEPAQIIYVAIKENGALVLKMCGLEMTSSNASSICIETYFFNGEIID